MQRTTTWSTLLFAAALPAQSTWIVDDAPGPGVHFTSLPAAVAAAASGDTLLVRAGGYAGFSVTGKALTIRLDGGGYVYVGAIAISAVPPGASFVLAGLACQPSALVAPALEVDGGSVLVLDCHCSAVGAQRSGLSLAGGSMVHAQRSTFRGGNSGSGQLGAFGSPGAAVAAGASLVAVACSFDGGDAPYGAGATLSWGGSGISSAGAMDLRDVSVQGGDGGLTGAGSPGQGGLGIWVADGSLRVAGNSTVGGGVGYGSIGGASNGSAVARYGGSAVVHAGVALVATGVQQTVGAVQFDTRALPRLSIAGMALPSGELAAVQPVTLALSNADPGALFFFAVGLAPAFQPLGPIAVGDLFVDVSGPAGALSVGVLGPNGAFSASLVPAATLVPLLGLPLHAQAGAWHAGSMQVLASNPVVRTFSL